MPPVDRMSENGKDIEGLLEGFGELKVTKKKGNAMEQYRPKVKAHAMAVPFRTKHDNNEDENCTAQQNGLKVKAKAVDVLAKTKHENSEDELDSIIGGFGALGISKVQRKNEMATEGLKAEKIEATSKTNKKTNDSKRENNGKTLEKTDHLTEEEQKSSSCVSLASKTLREYQQVLVNKVLKRFQEGSPSVLLYLPTGGGKTAIAANIIKTEMRSGVTGIFVHRDELAWQMEKSLTDWGIDPADIAFVKSSSKIPSKDKQKRILIISIQTFASRYIRKFSEECDRPELNLIIIDEAHHALADEYMSLVGMYPDARVVGLTATPFRLKKGETLGDLFYERVNGPSIRELTISNWLVPSVFISSSVSMRAVGRRAAQHPTIITSVVLNWVKHWSTKRTLVFCVDLAHAIAMRDQFRACGQTAEIISGKMKKPERDRLFEKSKEGEVSVLCSVDVVSEGVDTVWMDCLMMMRPTESRGLFLQQIGRGLRPYPDKSCCIILDEVGNVYKHGFIDDITDTEDEEVRQTKVQVHPCARTRCRALVEKKRTKCFLCIRLAETKTKAEEDLVSKLSTLQVVE